MSGLTYFISTNLLYELKNNFLNKRTICRISITSQDVVDGFLFFLYVFCQKMFYHLKKNEKKDKVLIFNKKHIFCEKNTEKF